MGRQGWSFGKRRPLGGLSALFALAVVLVAVFAPLVAPYDPLAQHAGRTLEGMGRDFWLGTDQLGRDILSRIVYGTRVSLTVGFLAVALGTSGGVALGILSGFQGGKLDLYIQRLVDAWMAFPGLILTLALVGILGASLINVSIAIAIVTVPVTARLVRGTVLSVKEYDFVEAAISIGARRFRVAVMHILPNIMAPILIVATARLGTAILTEASLSFLGLGVPPPVPTWGGMLAREGRDYMITNPLLAMWPGLAIMFTVMAFNLFGDALRDLWDPRLRGGH